MSSGGPRHLSLLMLSFALVTSTFAQPPSTPDSETHMTRTATGSFEVKLAPQPIEAQPEGSTLARMSIDKTISGDLQATTQGQMLSAMGSVKGSAGYVAMERVEGTLHGKRGSFVLMHRGVMDRGTPKLSVSVVPDSGSGELEGLSGDFDIIIEDGKHLYAFVYSLPGE